jgi:hypothetical protein
VRNYRSGCGPTLSSIFERGINFSINQIRAALGDDAAQPRFIETIPRRGYRFIGELEASVQPVIEPVAAPVVDVEPDHVARSRQPLLRIAAGVLVLAVVALAALTIYRWYRQLRPQEQTALNAVPFTAFPGEKTSPAFSLPTAPESLLPGTVILFLEPKVSIYT